MKLLILPILALASCAPKAVPVTDYRPQAAVQPVAAVAPSAAIARDATAKADTASAITADRIDTVSKQSASLRDGLSQAIAEADRLRQQKSATEAELEATWQSLNALGNRARDLFQEAEAAKLAAKEEKALREYANLRFQQMEMLAQQKDIENSGLKLQITDAETGSKVAHDSSIQATERAAKESARADKAEGKNSTLLRGFITSVVVNALLIIGIILVIKL